MKLYYYIETGHRVGLDRLRRSAPVVKALEGLGVDVTILTNDFRAGEYAKEQFGIGRYVSVDLVRNIANIATPADAVVLDTDDIGRSLLSDMIGYFGKVVRVSDNPDTVSLKGELLISSMCEGEGIVRADIVDPRYFTEEEHSLGNIYFWGDDDYDCILLKHADAFAGLDIGLLEGYYFFMQYADELEKRFVSIFENESYDETLKSAGRFITSSPQSALEALAAGSDPIYLKKEATPDFWGEKMASFGIPVVNRFSKSDIEKALAGKAEYARERLQPQKDLQIAQAVADFLGC